VGALWTASTVSPAFTMMASALDRLAWPSAGTVAGAPLETTTLIVWPA